MSSKQKIFSIVAILFIFGAISPERAFAQSIDTCFGSFDHNVTSPSPRYVNVGLNLNNCANFTNLQEASWASVFDLTNYPLGGGTVASCPGQDNYLYGAHPNLSSSFSPSPLGNDCDVRTFNTDMLLGSYGITTNSTFSGEYMCTPGDSSNNKYFSIPVSTTFFFI